MRGCHPQYFCPDIDLDPPDDWNWNGDECVHDEESDEFEQCGICDWHLECVREAKLLKEGYADYLCEQADMAWSERVL